MPVFQKGEMWSAYPEADLFLITTNSTLQPGNILVMGRGMAKAFQTKTDARQPASLFLIQRSTTALKQWAEAHPQAQIHLNFPGIGFGGLLREKVLPIVNQLPGNVTLWEYPDKLPTPPPLRLRQPGFLTRTPRPRWLLPLNDSSPCLKSP